MLLHSIRVVLSIHLTFLEKTAALTKAGGYVGLWSVVNGCVDRLGSDGT